MKIKKIENNTWEAPNETAEVIGTHEVKKTILDEARQITDGSRSEDYGNPEDNFQKIADYWHVYIQHVNINRGIQIGPKDVAAMMVLMKLAREDFRHKRDNLVDAVGYLRCMARILHEED